jgi:hypothetical protein
MLIYCGRLMWFTGRVAELAKPTTTQMMPERAPMRVPMRRRTMLASPTKGGRLEVEYERVYVEGRYRLLPVGMYPVASPGHNLVRWIEPYHDPRNPLNRYSEPTRRFERQKNHPRRMARRVHPRNA